MPSEQPREGTRVEKCRCGFPFYEDRFTIPQLDDGSVPDAWEFCPYCGGRLDEPAQPRGEGDDLAARLEAEACNIDAAIYDGLPSELRAERVGRRSAFREAAEMARASAQPEQPRGEEADGTLLLAIHYSGDHNPEQDRFAILDALPVEWPSGALLEEAEFVPAQPEGAGEAPVTLGEALIAAEGGAPWPAPDTPTEEEGA